MKNMIFKHYGHRNYMPELFNEVTRDKCSGNKPRGCGLWASPVGDEYFTWKDWNDAEEYMKCDEENAFTFTLDDDAKVFVISDVSDSTKLFKMCAEELPGMPREFAAMTAVYNFERLHEEFGYDAILFLISKDGRLYDAMYGWDCDSILILNPGVVRQEKNNN